MEATQPDTDYQDSHSHNHHHHGSAHGALLLISIVVTMLFVVGESIAAYWANSLALFSDAAHNFSDALALGMAGYAIWIAKKPAHSKRTYGYHRVAILTALFNAVTLVVIAFGIFVEAIRLFLSPEPVQGSLMMWVAAVAFLVNTFIASILMSKSHESLNMKAAFIHMAGDAASSLAVFVGGYVVIKTGWQYSDPLVSGLIGIFIIYSSWGIIKETTAVLLEGTPKGLSLKNMVESMKKVPHVKSVHDVHAWTVSDGMHYLSCHIVVDEAKTIAECAVIIDQLNHLLRHDFDIAHATIQTEMEGACCGGNEHCAIANVIE